MCVAETGPSRSKGEMCEAIGAALLIDDSLKYALQVLTPIYIKYIPRRVYFIHALYPQPLDSLSSFVAGVLR